MLKGKQVKKVKKKKSRKEYKGKIKWKIYVRVNERKDIYQYPRKSQRSVLIT